MPISRIPKPDPAINGPGKALLATTIKNIDTATHISRQNVR